MCMREIDRLSIENKHLQSKKVLRFIEKRMNEAEKKYL